MTIDVAELRTVIDNWATTVTRNGVVVKSTVEVDTSDLTELLDAYEELHRYDADREAGGDWLPLHLREAVAGLDLEQRSVVTDWYWRTNLLIGYLQTERDRLRAALQGIVTAIDNHHPKYKYGPFTLTRTEIDAARAALEGRE